MAENYCHVKRTKKKENYATRFPRRYLNIGRQYSTLSTPDLCLHLHVSSLSLTESTTIGKVGGFSRWSNHAQPFSGLPRPFYRICNVESQEQSCHTPLPAILQDCRQPCLPEPRAYAPFRLVPTWCPHEDSRHFRRTIRWRRTTATLRGQRKRRIVQPSFQEGT